MGALTTGEYFVSHGLSVLKVQNNLRLDSDAPEGGASAAC
jgi:hypothetical protein